MSVERKCECGAVMGAYDLDCKACGKGFKVRDEYLVGKDILPEPPVDLWAAQERYAQSKKRGRTRKSRAPRTSARGATATTTIFNLATILLIAASITLVIVFREPLVADSKTLPYAILAFTILISVIAFQRRRFLDRIVMSPIHINRNREYFRLLSSGFGHVDVGHLVLNAFGLLSLSYILIEFLVGAYGEYAPLAFLLIYLSAIVISDIPDLIRHRNDFDYSSVGASGAISAVIAGAAISDPDLLLTLYFIPSAPAVPGYVYAFGYLAISIYLDYRGRGRVAHLAHAAGVVYGLAVVGLISVAFGLGFAAA
jgi:membrane associated rhomboid family serine protease